MQIFPHGNSHPGQSLLNGAQHHVEPIAVFFTEDGKEVMIHESKLTDAQREEGRYLLIEPGRGVNWVPGKIDRAFQASEFHGNIIGCNAQYAERTNSAIFIGNKLK